MSVSRVPSYAVFDDYTYSLRISVVVRWFLLVTWLFLINYRRTESELLLYAYNSMGLALGILNGYVHWRIRSGRPVTRAYVLLLSAMDLTVITSAIALGSRFDNTFFVFYYPALIVVSLVFPSRRLSFAVVSTIAAVYSTISVFLSPGVAYSDQEEKVLIVRVVTMFAVVAAANLMTRIERERRREAVEAERSHARENPELQQKAQDAQIAALKERERIAMEIHDGVAQSVYMLSLSLETLSEVPDRDDGQVRERLKELVPLSKQALLEVRQVLPNPESTPDSERGLVEMAQNRAQEFQTVARIPVELSVLGEPRQVPSEIVTGLNRIIHESLANVFKHAKASGVSVSLAFEDERVKLDVQDDGVEFSTENGVAGHGLENMRQRASELSGSCKILSAPGDGTLVTVSVPA